MTKPLHFIAVTPGNLSFAWETEVMLTSIKERDYFEDYGLTIKISILVAKDENQEKFKYIWNRLSNKFPQVDFYYYETESIKKLIKIYPPVIRPHILKQHFKLHPELEKEVIFYTDTDILFTKDLPFLKWMDDDICYLSKTPYIGANYFKSKEKDVYCHKLFDYQHRDILSDCCNIVRIKPEIVIKNEENTGGCQYLLKNIDWKFWEKLEKDCYTLRSYIMSINQTYFSSEDKGFQSWCADMWGLLWNLWLRGQETRCPEELNFNWNTTPISEWNKCAIYHNAGVVSTFQELDGEKVKMFNKSDLRFRADLITPFDVKKFENVSDKYCGYNYLMEILKIEDPVSKSEGLLVY